MQRSQNELPIFIYQKMEPRTAQSLLLQRIKLLETTDHLKYQQLVASGKAWIVRESRVDGMLTIHSYTLKSNTETLPTNEPVELIENLPQRICLCNKGWVINNYSPGSKEFSDLLEKNGGLHTELTAENAGAHLSSFHEAISLHNFPIESRINPHLNEQSKTKTYSGYQVALDILNDSVNATLPVELTELLCCPLDKDHLQKIMKDPVVLATPVNDPQHLLEVGKSYEKKNLLKYARRYKLRMHEGIDYYENHILKSIIRYISTVYFSGTAEVSIELRREKLEKIATELDCPILFDVMTTPVITAAGSTYEKKSIDQHIDAKTNQNALFMSVNDPITGENITGRAIVTNHNLARFIGCWPKLYENETAKLTSNQLINTKTK